MSQPIARTCYKQHIFVPRIEEALGVSLGAVSCFIVNRQGMTKVMEKSGWNQDDTHGVVGFQVGGKVYVLDGSPWTTLHELVHKAGINADRLNRFVAEGLTEAIARELKESPDEHQPTYPAETTWAQTVLLPRLGLTAVQLGAKLTAARNAPKVLVDLLMAADPTLDRSRLLREMQPQKPDKPSLNCQGCRTMGSCAAQSHPSDNSGSLAGLLLVSGLALAAPHVATWWNQRRTS